jgi:hypothetical protein
VSISNAIIPEKFAWVRTYVLRVRTRNEGVLEAPN